jgi:hypothetical protein
MVCTSMGEDRLSLIKDMLHKFHSVNEALMQCTSYYAELDYDHDVDSHMFWLVDGCGDRDGDPFYDINDMIDYVSNNSEVEDYLIEVGV